MKAILVIDMPKCCEECRLINSHYDNEYGWQIYCGADYHRIREKNKKHSCPLKPMPQKRKTIEENKEFNVDEEKALEMMAMTFLDSGWNACIEAILGEE